MEWRIADFIFTHINNRTLRNSCDCTLQQQSNKDLDCSILDFRRISRKVPAGVPDLKYQNLYYINNTLHITNLVKLSFLIIFWLWNVTMYFEGTDNGQVFRGSIKMPRLTSAPVKWGHQKTDSDRHASCPLQSCGVSQLELQTIHRSIHTRAFSWLKAQYAIIMIRIYAGQPTCPLWPLHLCLLTVLIVS